MKVKVRIFTDEQYKHCVYEEVIEVKSAKFTTWLAGWVASTTVEVWDTEVDADGEVSGAPYAEREGIAYVEVSDNQQVYHVEVDCFEEPHYLPKKATKQTVTYLQ